MKAWTTLFVVGMFLVTTALADDVDDVKATVRSYYTALNAGDSDAWRQHVQAGYSYFNSDGGLLGINDSPGELAAGIKRNLQPRHIEVSIYGNLTAVATHYVVGTRTLADGTVEQRNSRRTVVLIKQGGQWKQVHRHQSPLTLSTPRIEDRFVGTWRLAAFERRGPEGEINSANPYSNGLLVYTPTGHISLQLTRENRQEFDGRASGEEAQAALYSYIAYFGTFTANERQGTITHHRQGHLIPDRVTDGLRYYKFSDNRLTLMAPPTGEGMTTTLTWERME